MFSRVRLAEGVNLSLKISEFAKVAPTQARYYLAFLAREGLVDEVITTNTSE